MYSMIGGAWLSNYDFLSQMALERKFDSNISIVEQRSLSNYLIGEIKQDFTKYRGGYKRLKGINVDLDKNIDDYYKSLIGLNKFVLTQNKNLPNFKEIKKKLKKSLSGAKSNISNIISNMCSLAVQEKDRIIDGIAGQLLNSPIFIELNNEDLNIGNHNPLQDLIVENSRKNETFNYIVSGTIKEATHFF